MHARGQTNRQTHTNKHTQMHQPLTHTPRLGSEVTIIRANVTMKHCSDRIIHLLSKCFTGLLVHGTFLPESMIAVSRCPV